MSFLWYLVWFVIAVGLLVTVHEFGHFWVARRLGFKVLRFSVGFGKPLITRVAGPWRGQRPSSAAVGRFAAFDDSALLEVPEGIEFSAPLQAVKAITVVIAARVEKRIYKVPFVSTRPRPRVAPFLPRTM